MNFLNELQTSIIFKLVQAKIEVQIIFYEGAEPNKIAFAVSGFYKSGNCILVPNETCFDARTRYDQEDKIETLDDLIALNFEWWDKSKTRSAQWYNPSEGWDELMVQTGRMTRKVETIITYHPTN